MRVSEEYTDVTMQAAGDDKVNRIIQASPIPRVHVEYGQNESQMSKWKGSSLMVSSLHKEPSNHMTT